MPSRRPLQFYSQNEIDRVCSIALPPKIKCNRCNQNLITTKFSNKQLTDARYCIKEQGRIFRPIKCMKCTGQQAVELECRVCDKTQGLECFAKTQRNNPDTAVCYACMEIQVNDAAIHVAQYDDPDMSFTPDDRSTGHTPEYWAAQRASVAAPSDHAEEWGCVHSENKDERQSQYGGGIALSDTFQTMNMTCSADESLIGSEYGHPGKDGVDKAHGANSWYTISAGFSSMRTGFNKQAYGQPMSSATSGTSRSFTSSIAERSSTGHRSSGWAKIRSARNPSPTFCGPTEPVVNATGESESKLKPDPWADEDEEDDDDDDDDDDDEAVI